MGSRHTAARRSSHGRSSLMGREYWWTSPNLKGNNQPFGDEDVGSRTVVNDAQDHEVEALRVEGEGVALDNVGAENAEGVVARIDYSRISESIRSKKSV